MLHRSVAFIVILAIAAVASAEPPAPFIVLKQTLGLTDEQLTTLNQLLEARRAAIEPLQRQIAAHNENFQRSFESILTPQQRAQLDTIRAVEATLHAAEALHALGF